METTNSAAVLWPRSKRHPRLTLYPEPCPQRHPYSHPCSSRRGSRSLSLLRKSPCSVKRRTLRPFCDLGRSGDFRFHSLSPRAPLSATTSPTAVRSALYDVSPRSSYDLVHGGGHPLFSPRPSAAWSAATCPHPSSTATVHGRPADEAAAPPPSSRHPEGRPCCRSTGDVSSVVQQQPATVARPRVPRGDGSAVKLTNM